MSVTVQALLEGPLAAALAPRVVPDRPRPVTRVTLLEEIGSTDGLLPGSAVVLTRRSAASAGGYQLDVLVRWAAEHRVAALILRRSTRRSLTAEQLARRGRLALLDVADDVDPASLLESLSVAVAGEARESLTRLAAAARWLDGAGDVDVDQVVAQMSQLCGMDLRYVVGPSDEGSPVEVDGRVRGALVTDDPREEATIAIALTAAAISRTLSRVERAELSPVRSTVGILGQILSAPQTQLPDVAQRARELGFLVDGWHVAVRLALDNAADVVGGTALALHDLEEEVLALVARTGLGSAGRWSGTVPDDTIVLVHSQLSAPAHADASTVHARMVALVHELTTRHPRIHTRAGIGGVHQGPTGLRVSAGEARTALASARLSDQPGSIAVFDSRGLRRMLAEWLVTDTARDTVSDLLAPLDALGPERSRTAVRTLHAYLDERGSLQRAAARLHLHRNAVVYRMSQITQVLDTDLQDPDRRFALQLACRARLLTSGET